VAAVATDAVEVPAATVTVDVAGAGLNFAGDASVVATSALFPYIAAHVSDTFPAVSNNTDAHTRPTNE
jgi:hypothetical protein